MNTQPLATPNNNATRRRTRVDSPSPIVPNPPIGTLPALHSGAGLDFNTPGASTVAHMEACLGTPMPLANALTNVAVEAGRLGAANAQQHKPPPRKTSKEKSWWASAMTSCYRVRKIASLSSVLLLGLALVYGLAPQLSMVLQSTASLVNVLSETTSGISTVGINLTASATDVAVTVARGSLSLLGDAWSGVDVTQAMVSASGARWYMHGTIDVEDFLDTPAGKALVQLPTTERHMLAEAIKRTSPLVPSLKDTKLLFNTTGLFREFSYQVKYLRSGFRGIQFYHGEITFIPRWANPLWEAMDWDVSREVQQLKDAVAAALDSASHWQYRFEELPAPNTSDILAEPQSWGSRAARQLASMLPF